MSNNKEVYTLDVKTKNLKIDFYVLACAQIYQCIFPESEISVKYSEPLLSKPYRKDLEHGTTSAH